MIVDLGLAKCGRVKIDKGNWNKMLDLVSVVGSLFLFVGVMNGNRGELCSVEASSV